MSSKFLRNDQAQAAQLLAEVQERLKSHHRHRESVAGAIRRFGRRAAQ